MRFPVYLEGVGLSELRNLRRALSLVLLSLLILQVILAYKGASGAKQVANASGAVLALVAFAWIAMAEHRKAEAESARRASQLMAVLKMQAQLTKQKEKSEQQPASKAGAS